MSRSLNRVVLIGHAGTSPTVSATASGARVATFRLATQRPSSGGQTDWHTIVAWDALATMAERFVRSGDRVFVEGRIETRKSERRGRTRFVTEIVAEELIPLGGRDRPGPRPAESGTMPDHAPPIRDEHGASSDDDDLPF